MGVEGRKLEGDTSAPPRVLCQGVGMTSGNSRVYLSVMILGLWGEHSGSSVEAGQEGSDWSPGVQ